MKRLLPFAIALLIAAPLAWADDKGHDHMAAKNGQPQPHDMAAMSAEEFAKLCWRAFKTDQPCAFKIDQGWMPKIEVFGEFRV